MFYELASRDPLIYCASVLLVIVSIVLHELAHGAMAIRLGDDTPRILGRMTFDPLVHMGWLSLVLLLILGMAFGSMPVDRRKLRGRFAATWVALAGPAMNFALAVVFAIALNAVEQFASPQSEVARNVARVLQHGAFLNIALGIFNLIPVPPLDGYAALASASRPFARVSSAEFFQRYAFLLVFVLLSTRLGYEFFQFISKATFALRQVLPFGP